jgi:hypothetical protein
VGYEWSQTKINDFLEARAFWARVGMFGPTPPAYCSCMTWLAAAKSASPSPATPRRSTVWRSARTAAPWPPQATPVGKLHDDRYLPLHPHLVTLTDDYRQAHVRPDHPLLLPRENGRPAAIMAATQRPFSTAGFTDKTRTPARRNLPSWAVIPTPVTRRPAATS